MLKKIHACPSINKPTNRRPRVPHISPPYFPPLQPALLPETTIKASDTLQHQPTIWPVPYTCAQPYHPGSGSHRQLFDSALLGHISKE